MEILVIAIAIGWLRGGTVKNLAKVGEVNGLTFFLLSAFILMLLVFGEYGTLVKYQGILSALYFLSFISILVGLYLNRATPGVKIAFIGTFSNLLAIGTNGMKMPVSIKVMEWVPLDSFSGSTQALTHQMFSSATNFKILADVIVVPPNFLLSGAYSLGDLLLYAGIIFALQEMMVSAGESHEQS